MFPAAIATEAVATVSSVRAEEEDLTTDLLSVGAQMYGLEFRMKSPSSLARKISMKREMDPTRTPAQITDRLTDLVRYTALARTSDDLVPLAKKTVATLLDRGCTLVEVEQSYVDGNPYKGLHTLIKTPGGRVIELQFHSQASQDAKNGMHVDYEIERDPTVPLEQRRQARERMVILAQSLTMPAGLDDLGTLGGVSVQTKTYPNPYQGVSS